MTKCTVYRWGDRNVDKNVDKIVAAGDKNQPSVATGRDKNVDRNGDRNVAMVR